MLTELIMVVGGNSKMILATKFFTPNLAEIVYDTRPLKDHTSLEELKEGLAAMRIKKTLFDRVPLDNAIVRNANDEERTSLPGGQMITTVKFLCRPKEGEMFFFVYRNYDTKIRHHKDTITKACNVLKDRPEFQVEGLHQVSLGGLFAYKPDDQEHFMRIRVTKINLELEKIKYLAVDEGREGSCKITELLFLNDDCTRLEMLAVPGVFGTDPPPALLKKFESGNFTFVRVAQPALYNDYGPRKLCLIH